MSTPALDRATEAAVDHYLDHVKGDEDYHYGIGERAARAVVSAALHDPDDPDWLEKIIRNVRLSLVGRDDFEVDRLTAVAVRAAILGSDE